jgi:hypothetical protein
MAPHGDYHHKESAGSGYRFRGSRSYEYDDEGRGGSKSLWEWFEQGFTDNDEKKVWLMNQDDDTCYRLIKGSTYRFGIEDIATINNPDLDTRARRLVMKKLSKGDWDEYWKHLVDGYERQRGELEKRWQERHDAQQEEYEAERVARMAVLAKIRDEDVAQTTKTVELSAGALRAEFSDVFTLHERSGADEGDWIDDVVEGTTTGHGFGYEQRENSSVKLQITLSLDMSNSMYYNRINTKAMTAFYEIGQTLRALQSEFPNDLFAAFFEFSLDSYNNGRGKAVRQLTGDDPDFGPFKEYRPSEVASVYGNGRFDGEDTWISPLLENIEKWEADASDSGAIKLDLVITDAVLEHVGDIKDGSIIQDRRDGSLQTVLLNLMPETEWGEVSLPRHCYQYHVDADNLSGALRNMIMEFVNVQL